MIKKLKNLHYGWVIVIIATCIHLIHSLVIQTFGNIANRFFVIIHKYPFPKTEPAVTAAYFINKQNSSMLVLVLEAGNGISYFSGLLRACMTTHNHIARAYVIMRA